MKVKELIEYLNKCDPEAQVLYDAEVGMRNADLTVFDSDGQEVDLTEMNFGVQDILQGRGVLRGRVYLSEEEDGE